MTKYRYQGAEYDGFQGTANPLKPVLCAELGAPLDWPTGVHSVTFNEAHPTPGSGYILFMPDQGWTPGGSPHQYEYATEVTPEGEPNVRVVTKV